MLYSRFEKLPEEKKERILKACIEEFSQNSYDNASTNRIVEKSGISKGILFHYFGNKRNLYFYVFDYVLGFVNEYIMEKLNKAFKDPKADFFERLIKTGFIKMELAHEHPVMYGVLFSSINVPNDLRKDMQSRYEKTYKKYMSVLLDKMDVSKFRKGIDRNKAVEIIFFALEGLSSKYMNILKGMTVEEVFSRMEGIIEDYYEYIDIIKNGIYQ
ncbi:MAG: TetR/AcrR family transcriptional regulator [Acetivibrionales bacterium]|jgi:TetR/AcrR family transcriptional regulator